MIFLHHSQKEVPYLPWDAQNQTYTRIPVAPDGVPGFPQLDEVPPSDVWTVSQAPDPNFPQPVEATPFVNLPGWLLEVRLSPPAFPRLFYMYFDTL